MNPELVIRIDVESTVPAYRQITDAIRAYLVTVRLAPGTRLPTVRQLAVDLSVHHNTVAQAYRELASEGWLELRRHRGATVRKRDEPVPAAGAEEVFCQQLRELVAKARAKGIKAPAIAETLERLSLSFREMDGWSPQ